MLLFLKNYAQIPLQNQVNLNLKGEMPKPLYKDKVLQVFFIGIMHEVENLSKEKKFTIRRGETQATFKSLLLNLTLNTNHLKFC